MSEYVVCVFGSGGVGKSCLTMQLVQGVFLTKYDPTIEDVYKTTVEVDEKQYSLEILDTAGSEEFSSMRDLYVKDGQGFVLVYSITSQATFNELNEFYKRIMAVKDVDTHGPPALVLVGNKNDLEDERVVSRDAGQTLARKWNCTFLETTAKNRLHVTEVFYDLIRQMNQKNPAPRTSKLVLSTETEPVETNVEYHTEDLTAKLTIGTKRKKQGCCVLL